MLRRALALFLILSFPLRANLGDSVQKCVERYGKPTGYSEAGPKSPFGTLLFVAGGYQLIVFLLNDVEVGARVSKTDKTAFDDAEMKTIMNAEAPASWVPTSSDDPSCLQWTRPDKATVLYDRDKKLLIFTSTRMASALHEASAAPIPAPPSPAIPATPVTPARAATSP